MTIPSGRATIQSFNEAAKNYSAKLGAFGVTPRQSFFTYYRAKYRLHLPCHNRDEPEPKS